MNQYDLNPNTEMSPIIGLLHAMISYNYSRLKRLVDGLSQEEIDYRGSNDELNSIAQLLWHLAVVDLHWVYRLQSKEIPTELKEKFGPMYDSNGKLPMISNIPLQIIIEEYDQIQDMLSEICTRISDDDLVKIVPFHNGNSATIRWGIWHVADHSRHHYANVAQIKKLLS